MQTGDKLGVYEVIAKLGEGGMGEVFRARDPRLGRDVAIKILPPDVAHDADRRARFEREARAVAALSHPNILALHDIGSEGDRLFVVTELLEGQTLAERLQEGAMPLRKAIEVAIAIARGLSAAHGKGIAHRDLKPANVFLLADGQVKLLDFGLARTTPQPMEEATPTLAPLTDAGMVMGTAGYMAPEQVRAQVADGRADLFALGVVLYEMLSGQRPFTRESTVETLNAVLKEEPPDLMTARTDLPAALDRIVRHCLEKSPAERFQSARDVIFALESLTVATASGSAPLPTTAAVTRHGMVSSARVAWAVAATLAAAMALLILWPRSGSPANGSATFLAIGAPQQGFHTHPSPALSPDGTTVAFWAPDAAGRVVLWVRDLHRPQARPIPEVTVDEHDGTAMQPAFSPDGRTLLVFGGSKLKRVPIDGGSPQTLADAQVPRGATWGADDRIVFQPAVGGPLFVIAASGGTPQPLPDAKPIDDRRAGPRHPYFLPDGKHFLFNDLARIYVASVDGGAPRLLVEASSRAEYAAGHLLYVKGGSLMAHPFDPVTLQLSGSPQRVVGGVGSGVTSTNDAAFSASANRTLVFWEGQTAPLAELVWLDRAGRRIGTIDRPGYFVSFSAMSDASRVAIEHIDLDTNWYASDIIDVPRGVSSRIPVSPIDRLNALTPMLSPDGRRVWFSAGPGIFRLDIGRDSPELIGVNQGVVWITDVSRDGQWLLYRTIDPKTGGDIWALPLTGDPKPVPWLTTPEEAVTARFSPDGKWVAFVQRDADGRAVYLDSFPARGRVQRISPRGGSWPMWSRDGTRVTYLSPDYKMMEVQLAAAADGPHLSAPTELFQAPRPNSTVERLTYWPAEDGRFLAIARIEEAVPRTINVLLNWPALVGATAPGSGR